MTLHDDSGASPSISSDSYSPAFGESASEPSFLLDEQAPCTCKRGNQTGEAGSMNVSEVEYLGKNVIGQDNPPLQSLRPSRSIEPSKSESRTRTKPSISSVTDHEEALLTRHFAEVLGPWLDSVGYICNQVTDADMPRMDLFDAQNYFSSHVPIHVEGSPLIRYSAFAISAKQLARTGGYKTHSNGASRRLAVTQTYPQTNWCYKAAHLYDKAISYLQLYLRQALVSDIDSGSLASTYDYSQLDIRTRPQLGYATSQQARTNTARHFSGPLLDELLVATSILSVYEFLDGSGAEWVGQAASAMISSRGKV